jgi:hypothetical protein
MVAHAPLPSGTPRMDAVAVKLRAQETPLTREERRMAVITYGPCEVCAGPMRSWWQALLTHVASSSFTPTAADVRRIAVSLANTRVDRELTAQRDASLAAGVPPTDEWRAARLAFDQAAARRARDLEPAPDNPTDRAAVVAAARAAIDTEQGMTA